MGDRTPELRHGERIYVRQPYVRQLCVLRLCAPRRGALLCGRFYVSGVPRLFYGTYVRPRSLLCDAPLYGFYGALRSSLLVEHKTTTASRRKGQDSV